MHFISLENIRISFLFSCSKYRKCRHCAKTIAIMAKSMTNWKAVSSSRCFTHGGQIRDAVVGKTEKIVVLPRFGAYRSKTFSFRRPYITLGLHNMDIANLNKSENFLTNTTTASKYIPKRPRICIN